MSKQLGAGSLIAVDGSKGFNHGCTDYAVLEYLGGNKAKVVQAGNCTSCWQVGHDQGHIFAVVGEEWEIDQAQVRECETWSTQIDFEIDR